MALKRMNIKVSEDMHAWLQQEANKRGLTMNAVIIFALETYYNQTTVMPNIPKMMEALEKLEQQEKESK
jgi:acetoin utilization deacetylase AcuC-like enzyme